jgi:hypothetical protein
VFAIFNGVSCLKCAISIQRIFPYFPIVLLSKLCG